MAQYAACHVKQQEQAITSSPTTFLVSCAATVALRGIRAYQRYLSPYKGFSCAYRVLAAGDSCSAYGYKVIARQGLRLGWPLLQRRLRACGERHRQHRAAHAPGRSSRHRAQAGYCDLPVADCGDCACDCADLVDLLSLRWPGRNRNSTWSGSGYASSAALKKQQAEHRKKIRQGQGHGN